MDALCVFNLKTEVEMSFLGVQAIHAALCLGGFIYYVIFKSHGSTQLAFNSNNLHNKNDVVTMQSESRSGDSIFGSILHNINKSYESVGIVVVYRTIVYYEMV